ncbi:RNA cap guanine-N2 methyltransferase-domain-containing protein [Coemansia spiralis]|nr:RNA cap guanine-N2 methyltransferase-domain-containing protein [Coemansia spiralis]
MGKRKRGPQLQISEKASAKKPKHKKDDKTFTTPEGQTFPIELKRYWDIRRNLFWRFDEGIQIDEEGLFSVTPEIIAQDTASRVAQLHNKKDEYGRICVIDAFCGVGGNTIKFAEWCEHVIAIDVDTKRLEMARNNAEVYGVAGRIEFILGDFYQLAPTLKADVVFMSPPWGGPKYVNADAFDLDSMPFHTAQEWMDSARRISDNVVFFMPRNCDPIQLADLCPDIPCDIELNYTNGIFKAITAYYGDLAHCSSSNPRQLLPNDSE